MFKGNDGAPSPRFWDERRPISNRSGVFFLVICVARNATWTLNPGAVPAPKWAKKYRPETLLHSRSMDIVPDTVALIIWLLAGVTAGMAAGELLKGDYDLGPGNLVAGGIGGVVGAQILQFLIPALRGLAVGPIVGQMIVAAISGAVLTVVTGAVRARRRR